MITFICIVKYLLCDHNLHRILNIVVQYISTFKLFVLSIILHLIILLHIYYINKY